jgi:hypothetical protein
MAGEIKRPNLLDLDNVPSNYKLTMNANSTTPLSSALEQTVGYMVVRGCLSYLLSINEFHAKE